VCGVATIAGVPERRLLADIVEMDAQGRDLGFDARRMAYQQIALLARPLHARAHGWPGRYASVLDADAHDAQACQRLQGVDQDAFVRGGSFAAEMPISGEDWWRREGGEASPRTTAATPG
jgi:hypothetical protein